MDGLNLVLFLIAAFFGGLTSGVSGFAMGLVVSGVWLHIISPAQNALLIVLCGLPYEIRFDDVCQRCGLERRRAHRRVVVRDMLLKGTVMPAHASQRFDGRHC